MNSNMTYTVKNPKPSPFLAKIWGELISQAVRLSFKRVITQPASGMAADGVFKELWDLKIARKSEVKITHLRCHISPSLSFFFNQPSLISPLSIIHTYTYIIHVCICMWDALPKLLESIRFSSGLTLTALASAGSLGYIGNLLARPDLNDRTG